MTGEPLERLDPEIAALLRDAEPYPDVPRGVQARFADALASRIADFEGPDGGESSPPANPDPTRAAGALAPPMASGFVAWSARPLRTIAGTFLVGAAVGAALHAVVVPPRERIVYVDKPVPVAPQAVPSFAPDRVSSNDLRSPNTAASNLAPPALVPVPAVQRPSSSHEKPERSDKPPRGASDLGAEQTLLDLARRSLAQGRTDEALAPLDRHAQRYPEGILAEEREAIAVNVLVSLGRYPDARARADRFFKRYPGSLLRGSVEAALGAIPN